MLIKPEIEDIAIIASLRQAFELRIEQLAFLPLGGDQGTAVYRADAEDGTPYFCKLRRGDFDPISVELPRFLSEQGIAQIISPLLTTSGQLWAELGEFKLILYPFIEGTCGFEIKLTEPNWADFGAALKRIHTIRLPAALSQKIQKESFSAEWRDTCRDAIRRLEDETFEDPITLGLVEYFAPRRDIFLDLLERAEQLAQTLASRPTEWALCHSDIHPGNLHIGSQSALFIVDWDYPMLAPKERDLMFIGGGQGYKETSEQEEVTNFYRHYGSSPPVDPLTMAYYRCERNLIDLSVETGRIFSSTLGDQDRAMSLQIITWLFLPGGSIEMAYKALDKMA